MSLVPQESFRGYRIAVDAGSFCFRVMMRARSKVVASWNFLSGRVDEKVIEAAFYCGFMQEIIELTQKGITLVFVPEFGKHPLKKKENEKRERERLAALERIEELYSEIGQDVFSRANERLMKELRSLESNLKSFPPGVKENVCELLQGLGIPIVKCKKGVESERVASILCRYDIAAAVYSRDGDCLAHGAPIQIKEVGSLIFNDGIGRESFVAVDYHYLLELIELTSEQFTDVCICAGCDYNDNIPGIAFIGSLKYIRNYGTVDNFPPEKDRSCLLYEQCLPEFGLGELKDLVSNETLELEGITCWEDFACLQVDKDADCGEVLTKFGLNRYRNSYEQKRQQLPEAQDFVHRVVTKYEIEGEIIESAYVNFLEGAEPYVKTTRPRK